MELIIDFSTKENKLRNSYEVIITFMENDADAYPEVKFNFPMIRMENPKFRVELEEFITSVVDCIDRDKRGRSGFDTYNGLMAAYGDIPNWYKYAFDSYHYYDKVKLGELLDFYDVEVPTEEYNSIFCYEVPTYSGGFYTSYNNLDIWFYDEDGDKYPVNIKFD